jgi:hypothetical protein
LGAIIVQEKGETPHAILPENIFLNEWMDFVHYELVVGASLRS